MKTLGLTGLLGEFYQLDMEMAFASQEDVFEVMEKVIYDTFVKFSEKKVFEYPFPRITYKEAMLKYGSDKPDLRNPLVIDDVTEMFQDMEFNAFKGKTVRAICVPDVSNESRKFFDGMVEFATENTQAKGLAWVKMLEDGSLQGSIAKFIDDTHKEKLEKITKLKPNGAVFFAADNENVAASIAGEVRKELGKRLGLIDENVFKFCWIIDFPMYELNDEGKVEFSHNPFSMPQGGMKALEEKDPLDILAYQYDIVCNGIELSSGAVRNHNPELMTKAFEIAGISKEVIEEKFSAMFDAFHYGAPPHAGIAPGLDRMLMLLAGEENIRSVIAFPMNSKAQDLLMGAPRNCYRYSA